MLVPNVFTLTITTLLLVVGGAALLLVARSRNARGLPWGGAFLIGLPSLVMGLVLVLLGLIFA